MAAVSLGRVKRFEAGLDDLQIEVDATVAGRPGPAASGGAARANQPPAVSGLLGPVRLVAH